MFTAHSPHTTILDERISIHCNSSCLYNRRGSTDVYVLYSRVHFYYLKIKDCVEEHGGSFFIDFIGVTDSVFVFFLFLNTMLKRFKVRNNISTENNVVKPVYVLIDTVGQKQQLSCLINE